MRNQVSKDELSSSCMLRNEINGIQRQEWMGKESTLWQGEKRHSNLAHKYLNEVLFMLDEYRMSIMKIPGIFERPLLLVTIFTTFMVLCITLPISKTNDSTLEESIFGLIENLQVKNAE